MLSTGLCAEALWANGLAKTSLTCNAFKGNYLSHLEKTMKKLIAALIASMFAVGAFAADAAPAAAAAPVAASAPAKKAVKKHHHKKAKKAAAAASAASK